MPRMYQILVTNQLNLRDYILYYPRDYRFPCRHNAWLSLWKVLTYHVTLAGDYFYHNFDVPRNSVVTRSVCYIIDSSNTVSSLHLHVCSTCVSDFFDFGYSESIRVQLAAANVLRRITSISWRPSVSRLCICVSVYLCICVSVYLCICVSVYLCICVSVYLSADISLNCAKNGSTDYPEILWVCWVWRCHECIKFWLRTN